MKPTGNGSIRLDAYPNDTAARVAWDLVRRSGEPDGTTAYTADRDAITVFPEGASAMIRMLGSMVRCNPVHAPGAARALLQLATDPTFPHSVHAAKQLGEALVANSP